MSDQSETSSASVPNAAREGSAQSPPKNPPGSNTAQQPRSDDARAQTLLSVGALLQHAVKQGIDLQDETIRTLLTTVHEVETNGWTVESECTFWTHYAVLAKAVHPVTADSLSILAPIRSRPPRAVREVIITSVVTGIALISLIVLQIYWVIGSNIVTTIDRLVAENNKNEVLRMAAIAQYQKSVRFVSEEEPAPAPPPAPETGEDVKVQLTNYELLLEQGHLTLEANYALLRKWSDNALNVFGPKLGPEDHPTAAPGPDDQEIELAVMAEGIQDVHEAFILSSAKSSLQSMASYVLPLLYGLVGACAYVLRAISRDVQNVVFVAGSPIHYRLRLLLGALSGIAVGWFFTPDQLPSGLSGIQPLALAFLAGYSVELLFAAMDRFIGAFSGEARPSR